MLQNHIFCRNLESFFSRFFYCIEISIKRFFSLGRSFNLVKVGIFCRFSYSEQHQASLRSNSELRKAVSQLEYENENIKRHYFEPQAEDILPKVYRNLDHQVDAMKEKVTKLEVENMKLILDKEAAEYKLSDSLSRLDLQQV